MSARIVRYERALDERGHELRRDPLTGCHRRAPTSISHAAYCIECDAALGEYDTRTYLTAVIDRHLLDHHPQELP